MRFASSKANLPFLLINWHMRFWKGAQVHAHGYVLEAVAYKSK